LGSVVRRRLHLPPEQLPHSAGKVVQADEALAQHLPSVETLQLTPATAATPLRLEVVTTFTPRANEAKNKP
jgi:hypothetical protein